MIRDAASVAALAVATLLALALLGLIACSVSSSAARRRRGPRRARARAALVEVLVDESPTERAGATLRSLPADDLEAVLVEIAPNLAGEQRRRLREIGRELGIAAHAERRCRSRRWWRRLRAVRVLTLVGGGEDTVPRLVDDRHVAIRAQVAEWAAANPTPARTELVTRMLDTSENLVRFAAQEALLRIGGDAVEPLARYLGGAKPPGLVAGLRVARGLAGPGLRDTALAFRRAEDVHVRAHAAALLGAVGGRRAVETLTEMTNDPAAPVRSAALRALGSLDEWSLAPAVAGVLADPSWPVRREAAQALRQLGPTGTVLLRRAARDPDPIVADLALHALDLPQDLGGADHRGADHRGAAVR